MKYSALISLIEGYRIKYRLRIRNTLRKSMTIHQRPALSSMLISSISALLGCATPQVIIPTYPTGIIQIPEHSSGHLIIKNNCVYFKTSQTRYFVVWPDQTTFVARGPGNIQDKYGRHFPIGSSISLMGGEISVDAFSKYPNVQDLMQRCGGPYFIVSGIYGE